MIQTTNNQLLQYIFWDSFVTQRRIPHGHGLDLSFQWPECPCWIILPELEIVQILIEKNMFSGHTSLHSWPKKPSTYPSPFSSYGANTKYLVDHLPFLVSHNSARLGTTLPRCWISRPLVDLVLSLNDHEISKKTKRVCRCPILRHTHALLHSGACWLLLPFLLVVTLVVAWTYPVQSGKLNEGTILKRSSLLGTKNMCWTCKEVVTSKKMACITRI